MHNPMFICERYYVATELQRGNPMLNSTQIDRLREQGARCRHLAQTASDEEVAAVLREIADEIDQALQLLTD